MRKFKILAHCPKCLNTYSYTILQKNLDELYQQCQKCKTRQNLIIDKGILSYLDDDDNTVEEVIVNTIDN